MVFITTIANQLNKDGAYVLKLCEDKQIEVHYDQDGVWIYDDQAKLLLDSELKTPTRYNFRGVECTEVHQPYTNIGDEPITLNEGERIGQLVVVPIFDYNLEVVDELEPTERGDGAFGSTGK